MTTVKIDEDYQIRIDNYNHTLLKAIRDESGAIRLNDNNEPQYKTMGYYGDVRQALVAVIHLKLAEKDETLTLVQYLDQLDELEDKFQPTLKRFKEGD
ncbi:hypothetical protein FEZ51_01975 [Pediococcus stilesii]|uniref:DUF5405 domain-containing protein n=1 Tax=Pediococcus stilesii TaxID=331679 RepID=A0A5R9BZD1_9LACO|nr:hypothetical protein [Pediococcus stilesii]TLQ05451.1 hypothetical protein FEZ51_01975 [Pediococcus stilesii]